VKQGMWILGAVLLCWAGAMPAGAQSGNRDQAAQQMELGSKQYRAGNYAKALQHYQKALDLLPTASGPYREMGKAHEAMGNLEKALQAYREYLRRKPDASDNRTIREYVLAIEKKLGLPSMGRIFVNTAPGGAEVHIDNPQSDPTYHTPVRGLELVPGTYVLFVSRPGYEPLSKKINVMAGEELKLDLALEPNPTDATPAQVPPAPAPAQTAAPVAQPLAPSPAPPAAAWAATAPERPGTLRRTLGWTALGVGLAAAGTGVGLRLLAGARISSLQSDLDSGQPMEYGDYLSRRDSARALETGGWVAVGAGGALLTAGAILLLLDAGGSGDPGGGPPAAGLHLFPTLDGPGLNLYARF
jgi:tetratricopeptide (TPR) repeat protein